MLHSHLLTTVRSSAAFAALCVLVACTGAPPVPNGALSSGRWAGHVQHDPAAPPVGVVFEVEGPPGALRIRLVSARLMGLPGADLEEVRLDGINLHFVWPRRDRWRCALRQQDGGVYEGHCSAPDDRRWGLRMVPPGRDDPPVGYAAWLLAHPGTAWRTHEAGGVRVHAPEGTDVDLAGVAAFAEEARSTHLALLGAESRQRLDVFLVADRAEMARLIGQSVGGFADVLGHAVVVAGLGRSRSVVSHELMHVLSFHAWGEVAEPGAWLVEGLATHAAGACRGHDLPELAARLAAEGLLLRPSDLVGRFYEQDDLVAYLQSAGLVGHLLGRYGRAAVHAAWTDGLPGLERATGEPFEGLHAGWLAALGAPPEGASPFAEVRALGCG